MTEVHQNKSLTHNALANLLQALIGGILSFVLYRYINDTLGVALLGVWSVVLATASASRLTDLGLSASVTRFVALRLARNTPKEAARVIETALLSLLLLMGLFLPILYWLLWQLLPHLFDAEYLASARILLPYAFFSLGLSMMTAVLYSGFEGCQRMDLRAQLAVWGQLLMVALAFLLVPHMRLIGLAWAQIGQNLFLLATGWWMLRRCLSGLPHIPRYWSKPMFREMLSYGANVQVASLFMLIFDPLTKALMARFGGADAAGYFEMANQIVLKVRALIVTANQAIVPRIAQLTETAPEGLGALYRENIRILVFFALPVFSLLFAWSGLFSWLLVGQVNKQLLFLLQLNTVAWLLNLFTAPAYFANLGIGQVGWNTLSHAIMGLINGGLGWLLGRYFGADGVAWAYFIALALGSWLLVMIYQKRNDVYLRELALLEHGWLLVASIAVAVVGHYAWRSMQTDTLIWVLMGIATLSLVIVAWRHPLYAVFRAKLIPRAFQEK